MLNEIATQLTAGPTLLAVENQPWIESCINGALRMSGETEQRLREAMANDNDDGFWPEPDDWFAYYRPYVVREGILQIPIRGVLLNNFSIALGDWATGYTYIRRAMQRGLDDPEVRGIALVLNTPGGDVSGNFDLVDMIYAAREQKPIQAFAADYAYSAGYSIASAAEKITVNRTGGVGSIGVVAWHADLSGMLEKMGIKMTPIYAGKHKIDGNQYQALPDDVKKRMQARIDALYGIFVQTVARNRGMEEQAVRDTEALTYSAEEAIEIGLADAVGSLDESVAAFARELNHTGGSTMSTNDKQTPEATAADLEQAKAAAHAEGMKEGASNERARVKGILAHAEAADRGTLAAHLAFETNMSVEDAAGMLAVAAKEAKPETTAAAPGKSAFEKAMDESGGAGVGANAGDGGDSADADTPDAKASAILRDFGAASGTTPKK